MSTAPPALAYVRLAVDHPALCAGFAEARLGLRRVKDGDDAILLRADQQSHRIALIPRHGGDEAVGIELADMAALQETATRLEGAGFATRTASAAECRAREVRAAILTRDATGNAVDLVVGPSQNAMRFSPAIDSGVNGLANIGLRSLDIARDTEFWNQIPRARVADRVGEITYIGLDRAHHRIVLHPASGAGVLYVCLSVESLDHLMQGYHSLAACQVKILQGPGRQPASGQVFLHVQGPDGVILSLGHGMTEADPGTSRPCQFAPENASLCSWGSVCDDVAELHFPETPNTSTHPTEGRTGP
jgi:2,3-dihydroxy-p-cumate/2,3-dihydroxybenzoate 3,4-dioxygenase